MAILKIPVEQLREGPVEFEVNLRPQALDLVDEEFKEFTFTGHVTGKVVFQLVGSDVLGHGNLLAHADTACVRCLAPAHVDIKAEVEETWMHNQPEEEAVDAEFLAEAPLTRSYSGDEIELDEVFRELIMSELPDRPHCSEECKGLCPGCGADLNKEECRCKPEEREVQEQAKLPEWKQALKNLKLK